MPNEVRISTGDRSLFKECRFKFDILSRIRRNRQMKQDTNEYLWFGKGIHYALEIYHSTNQYGGCVNAFRDYSQATEKVGELPSDVHNNEDNNNEDIGIALLHHYEHRWLKNRDPLKTFVYNGVVQTEVKFEIDMLGVDAELDALGYDKITYSGIIDRVTIDDKGRLWILDYKTTNRFSDDILEINQQALAYFWAGKMLYPEHEIGGVIWMEFLRTNPSLIEVKKNGGLSINKATPVSASVFEEKLIEIYGSVEEATEKEIEYFKHLISCETENQDCVIRRTFLPMDMGYAEREHGFIINELIEMLDPNLRIYPRPNRMCADWCRLKDVCSASYEGKNWEADMIEATQEPERREIWKDYLLGSIS